MGESMNWIGSCCLGLPITLLFVYITFSFVQEVADRKRIDKVVFKQISYPLMVLVTIVIYYIIVNLLNGTWR